MGDQKHGHRNYFKFPAAPTLFEKITLPKIRDTRTKHQTCFYSKLIEQDSMRPIRQSTASSKLVTDLLHILSGKSFGTSKLTTCHLFCLIEHVIDKAPSSAAKLLSFTMLSDESKS